MSGEPVDAPDVVDLYVRALAGFGEQVQAVGAEEWDLHTPCPDWDIRSMVAHVVLGESQIPELVAGRSVATAQVDVSVLGPEPMAAWRGTALAAIETVRSTRLDTVVRHAVGDVALATAVGFRITDNLVHAWDIATARSVDHTIDDEIAGWCLDFWQPLTPQLAGSAHFAPPTEPVDGRAGSRLLALLGRHA